MSLRSKVIQRFQLFSTALRNNQRSIENAAFISGTAIYAFYYRDLANKVAQDHVTLFKNRLTPDQRKEMETSPEKNREYKEQYKEELRQLMRDY